MDTTKAESMKDEQEAALALAESLRALFEAFPMGDDQGSRVRVAFSANGGPETVLELRTEEAAHVERLLYREQMDSQQCHPDQAGVCGHCHGTGRAGGSRDCPDCGAEMRWWQHPDLPPVEAQELGWWICSGCAWRVAGPYSADQGEEFEADSAEAYAELAEGPE